MYVILNRHLGDPSFNRHDLGPTPQVAAAGATATWTQGIRWVGGWGGGDPPMACIGGVMGNGTPGSSAVVEHVIG